MTKYCIVDVANLFHRCRHATKGTAYDKSGLALTIVFRSLKKIYRDMQANHIVLCLEGRSWRYEVYPQYKAERRLKQAEENLNESVREENEAFFSIMEDFSNFVAERTNCTVLQSDGIEGDDWIARWVQLHPKDDHIILTSDSDMVQLLAPNVSIYNGVDHYLIACDGITNDDGETMVFEVQGKDAKIKVHSTLSAAKKNHDIKQKENQDKYIKEEKERFSLHKINEAKNKATIPDYVEKTFIHTEYNWQDFEFKIEPDWWKKALFIKLIRGDKGDSVFSSYPGVRYKGSKDSTGIQDAWADRNTQSYNWNNFMLKTWTKLIGTDSEGNPIKKEVRVLDEYKFNELLIDLTKQPDNIKNLMDTVIIQAIQKEPVSNIGIHFLRFCKKNDLVALAKEAGDHAVYLSSGYV
jgi:5'-3' exonuclease